VTYFLILSSLNISGISKDTNCIKVVNVDDGNLRAELPSKSRGRPHSGRGPGKERGGLGGGFTPKLNIA